MNIEEVREICMETALSRGVELNVPVESNGRLRTTFGRVKYRTEGRKCIPERIEFSENVLSGDEAFLMDTLKHEMAHYIVMKKTGENHGHDRLWKEEAARLGCRPRATVRNADIDIEREPYRYEVICKSCGKVIGYYRRQSKVTKNPFKYRSNCCKANIMVNKLY